MELKPKMDKFQKENAKRKSYSTFDRLKVQSGDNEIRLLPRSMQIYTKGDAHFAHRYLVHYNMFDIKGYKMLVCRESTGEKCPVCEYLETVDDKTIKSKIGQRERFLFHVIDLRDSSNKLYETGPLVYDAVAGYWVDKDWGPAKMIDLEKGCVLKIDFTPADKSDTGWNKYKVSMAPREVNVLPFLGDKWEDVINGSIDAVPGSKSYDELVKLVQCFIDGRDPSDEEISEDDSKVEKVAEKVVKKSGDTVLKKPGSTPSKAEEKKEEAPKVETREKEAPKGSSDVPSCFGEEYAPRTEKCRGCDKFIKCRDSFMRG